MGKDFSYDVVVIGGGINGTAIAAAAASRGLKVFLCEQHDLGSGASSASSKLIHGGLRYLENYEFHLVKNALAERERLFKLAKHLVKPQAFILPNQPKIRSRWLVRIGLFLYDHLVSCSVPKTKTVNFKKHPAGKYLNKQYHYGFQFYDGRTNDARLVIANAQKAKQLGATIRTYTECMGVQHNKNEWQVELHDHLNNNRYRVSTKALINATGPWVEHLEKRIGVSSANKMALVKGSHIIIPRFYEGDFAYFLQNKDKRVIFVIPFLNDYLMVGTTDIVYKEETIAPTISPEEVDYLTTALRCNFNLGNQPIEIIHSFSGVRPLFNDNQANPSAISRGYFIEFSHKTPPLITIFGGKLTTFRALAEKVLSTLEAHFSTMLPYDVNQMHLPGSDYDTDEQLRTDLHNNYPLLPEALLERYQQQYGNLTYALLKECSDLNSLGKHFGANLYQKEVDYLIEHEWAVTCDDILWRRTHLGYYFPNENLNLLQQYVIDAHAKGK